MEMSAPTKLPGSDFTSKSCSATNCPTDGNIGVRGKPGVCCGPYRRPGGSDWRLGIPPRRNEFGPVGTGGGLRGRHLHRHRVSARRRDPIVGQCRPGPAGYDCESQIGSDHALSRGQCPNLSKHKRLCRNRVHALRNGLLGVIRVARDVEAHSESGVGNAVNVRGFLEQWVSEGGVLCSFQRREASPVAPAVRTKKGPIGNAPIQTLFGGEPVQHWLRSERTLKHTWTRLNGTVLISILF